MTSPDPGRPDRTVWIVVVVVLVLAVLAYQCGLWFGSSPR